MQGFTIVDLAILIVYLGAGEYPMDCVKLHCSVE